MQAQAKETNSTQPVFYESFKSLKVMKKQRISGRDVLFLLFFINNVNYRAILRQNEHYLRNFWYICIVICNIVCYT